MGIEVCQPDFFPQHLWKTSSNYAATDVHTYQGGHNLGVILLDRTCESDHTTFPCMVIRHDSDLCPCKWWQIQKGIYLAKFL